MKNILNAIINESKFIIPAFDGKLLLEGRILSPSEAQAAGLASGLIAASMTNPKEIVELERLSEDSENPDNMDRILQIARSIRPESLIAIGESHDRIICKVIQKASTDNGENWQRIHIVQAVDQQSADKNRLWVGMIPEDDRKAIIEKALEGHKQAIDKIRRSL